MPGPGGPGSQINSLMDLVQQQQPQAPPVASYGTWAPPSFQGAPPLYSGGSVGAVGMGGGGGGARVFNPPQDVAKYFDKYGVPKIDDPSATANEAGISLSQLAGGMLPRYAPDQTNQGYEYASDKGGFFTIEDLFNKTRRPVEVPGALRAGGQPNVSMQRQTDVPQIATWGMSRPSTNNWRLLGMGPGYIMRNGFLINAGSPGDRGLPYGMSSSSASAEHGMGGLQHVSLGTGAAYGMPNLYAPGGAGATAYWPGSVNGGIGLGPPSYWLV